MTVLYYIHFTGFRSKIFLACDNEPLSKHEICKSALFSKLYPDAPMPQVNRRKCKKYNLILVI